MMDSTHSGNSEGLRACYPRVPESSEPGLGSDYSKDVLTGIAITYGDLGGTPSCRSVLWPLISIDSRVPLTSCGVEMVATAQGSTFSGLDSQAGMDVLNCFEL